MSTEKIDNSSGDGGEGVATAAHDCLGPDGMLSIVMPVYNLGRVIRDNVASVHALFGSIVPFEIVPVDDGSADDTRSGMEIGRASCRERV